MSIDRIRSNRFVCDHLPQIKVFSLGCRFIEAIELVCLDVTMIDSSMSGDLFLLTHISSGLMFFAQSYSHFRPPLNRDCAPHFKLKCLKFYGCSGELPATSNVISFKNDLIVVRMIDGRAFLDEDDHTILVVSHHNGPHCLCPTRPGAS